MPGEHVYWIFLVSLGTQSRQFVFVLTIYMLFLAGAPDSCDLYISCAWHYTYSSCIILGSIAFFYKSIFMILHSGFYG